jgi:UDP-N-acetylmuramoylalanine--D-glutamate ligase
LGISPKAILVAFKTFRGVPHRQEQVGIVGNVVCINDSSATIPEAVAFSCGSCPWPYVLICGGTDKNLTPEAMRSALEEASAVFLLEGSFTRNKLIPLLQKIGIAYHGPFDSMDEAVTQANRYAQEYSLKLTNNGTLAIILSPGAASFGMFKHEFDRGDQFKAKVMELIAAR